MSPERLAEIRACRLACIERELLAEVDRLRAEAEQSPQYEQVGWCDDERWYDESTTMWIVDAWDVEDGYTPVFVEKDRDG